MKTSDKILLYGGIALFIAVLILVSVYMLYVFIYAMTSEPFTDAEKKRYSNIIFNSFRGNNKKINFDTYKKELSNYPDLLDVTIYSRVKSLENFQPDNIYNVLF